MSKESCGRENESLGGTRKGNRFLVSMCRDMPCFAFKELEKKRLVTILKSKHANAKVQISAISFVDDSDFCSGGVECDIKMRELVDFHANMHKATVGEVQKDKVMVHCWKWKNN